MGDKDAKREQPQPAGGKRFDSAEVALDPGYETAVQNEQGVFDGGAGTEDSSNGVVQPDERLEFIKQEHAICHEKIKTSLENMRRTETFAIIGLASFYAWFLTSKQDVLVQINGIQAVLWIPAIFVLLAAIRQFFDRAYIKRLCAYSMGLEQVFHGCKTGSLGWERYYKKATLPWINWIQRVILWAGLLLGTLLVACNYPAPLDEKASDDAMNDHAKIDRDPDLEYCSLGLCSVSQALAGDQAEVSDKPQGRDGGVSAAGL
ncbi:MAG: hypothetical protein AAF559_01465 [Pseudomonadota bacterium]